MKVTTCTKMDIISENTHGVILCTYLWVAYAKSFWPQFPGISPLLCWVKEQGSQICPRVIFCSCFPISFADSDQVFALSALHRSVNAAAGLSHLPKHLSDPGPTKAPTRVDTSKSPERGWGKLWATQMLLLCSGCTQWKKCAFNNCITYLIIYLFISPCFIMQSSKSFTNFHPLNALMLGTTPSHVNLWWSILLLEDTAHLLSQGKAAESSTGLVLGAWKWFSVTCKFSQTWDKKVPSVFPRGNVPTFWERYSCTYSWSFHFKPQRWSLSTISIS